jgi:hypothetical protein
MAYYQTSQSSVTGGWQCQCLNQNSDGSYSCQYDFNSKAAANKWGKSHCPKGECYVFPQTPNLPGPGGNEFISG